jgi:hypothetical protein
MALPLSSSISYNGRLPLPFSQINLELNRAYNASNSGLNAQLWFTASNSESAFYFQGQYAASTLISASQFRGYNHRTGYLDGVNDFFSSSVNLSGSGLNPNYSTPFSLNFWIRQEAIDVLPATSFQPFLLSSGRIGNFGAAYFALFYEGTLSGGTKSNKLIAIENGIFDCAYNINNQPTFYLQEGLIEYHDRDSIILHYKIDGDKQFIYEKTNGVWFSYTKLKNYPAPAPTNNQQSTTVEIQNAEKLFIFYKNLDFSSRSAKIY